MARLRLGRLTDPRYLLRYAASNPKQAALSLALGIVALAVVTVSLAVDTVPLWVGGPVAGIVALYVAWLSFGRVWFLLATESVGAGTVSDGAVKVSGQAVPATDARLSGPHTDKPCLAYYSKTVRSKQGSNESRSTRTDEGAIPFYVEDDTGQVLVDGRTALVTLGTEKLQRTGGATRYEGQITEGDDVTVHGEAVSPAATQGPDDGLAGLASATLDAGGAGDMSDLLAGEDVVVARGPDYDGLVVTDRSGWRLVAGQFLVALFLALIGLGLIGGSVAVALGVV